MFSFHPVSKANGGKTGHPIAVVQKKTSEKNQWHRWNSTQSCRGPNTCPRTVLGPISQGRPIMPGPQLDGPMTFRYLWFPCRSSQAIAVAISCTQVQPAATWPQLHPQSLMFCLGGSSYMAARDILSFTFHKPGSSRKVSPWDKPWPMEHGNQWTKCCPLLSLRQRILRCILYDSSHDSQWTESQLPKVVTSSVMNLVLAFPLSRSLFPALLSHSLSLSLSVSLSLSHSLRIAHKPFSPALLSGESPS